MEVMRELFGGGGSGIVTGQKSKFLEAKILNTIFNGTDTLVRPATLYLALFTALPTNLTDVATEPIGNNYGRIAYTTNTANFPAATLTADGTRYQILNAVEKNTPAPSGAWGDLLGCGFYDAATVGNLWYYSAFAAPILSGSFGPTYPFVANSIQITEA